MRYKLISIFLSSFFIFIVALVWRVDDLIVTDKANSLEGQLRSRMSPLMYSLRQELETLSALAETTIAHSADKKEFSAQSGLAKYQMIAELKQNESKEWQFQSILFQEKSNAKNWAQQYLQLLLKNIEVKDFGSSQFAIYSLLDPQRKPFLFIVSSKLPVRQDESSKYYAALVGADFFQKYVDQQKSQFSDLVMVNIKGQTLGHSVAEYVGNLLNEDPVASDVIKSNTGGAFGLYKNIKDENVFALYEQIPGSNAYLIFTTPEAELNKGRSLFLFQLILLGLGLAFLGVSVFVVLDKSEKNHQIPISSSSPQAMSTEHLNSDFSTEDANADRTQSYTQFAAALSHELKNPIASILGSAQLLRKTVGTNENINGIEENARRIHDLITKLLTFSGQSAYKTEKIKIAEVVQRAIKNIEPKFFKKGIQVHKEINSASELAAPPELIVKAIENILLNAVESMERNPNKNLKISLNDVGEKVELLIADSGEGIDKQNLRKVFDPFFTTRSTRTHPGLGLSVALGAMKSMQGELKIESERQKGTTVKMIFDPQAKWTGQVEAEQINTHAPSLLPEHKPIAKILPEIISTQPKNHLLSSLEDQEIEKVLNMDELDWSFSPQESTKSKDKVPKVEEITIETPKIKIIKRDSRLDQFGVQIRKPGEKHEG